MVNLYRHIGITHKSQLAAHQEAERWAKANGQLVVDRQGLSWKLKTKQWQEPSLEDAKAILWLVSLQLTSEVDAAELVRSQIFDHETDARLLLLLGEDLVPLALRPLSFSAVKEIDAIQEAEANILPYCRRLDAANIHELKHQTVCRFIDNKMRFA